MVRAHSRACALSVNAREALPQLDRSREFAALLVGGADGSFILLGDDEHRWSMGRHGVTGNCRHADARRSPQLRVRSRNCQARDSR
jgi:hypothetical protein